MKFGGRRKKPQTLFDTCNSRLLSVRRDRGVVCGCVLRSSGYGILNHVPPTYQNACRGFLHSRRSGKIQLLVTNGFRHDGIMALGGEHVRWRERMKRYEKALWFLCLQLFRRNLRNGVKVQRYGNAKR